MAADAKIMIGVDPAKDPPSFTVTDWVKLMDNSKSWADLRPGGDVISKTIPYARLRRVDAKPWGVAPPHPDSLDAFRYLYQGNFDSMRDPPSYLDRFQAESRLNRQEVDYEKAFWLALEETAYIFDGDEWPLVDPECLRHADYSPQFLDRWMWGPNGEFVALARVPELDLPAQKAAMDGAREFTYSNRTLGRDVFLHVTPLGTSSNTLRRFQTLFIRFADYHSLAIWRDSAERQSNHVHSQETADGRQIQGRRADRVIIDEYSMIKPMLDRKSIDALFAPGAV